MGRVLIGCEYSGVIRDAFAARGHDAWSCDLLPTESPGQHIQGDVLEVIHDDWDLLIAHPPCTYISYAGTRWWNDPGRCKKRLEALDFFRQLWEAPIKRICLENPRGCASPTIAKHSQVIEPYYFGDEASKPTWLWLKKVKMQIMSKTTQLSIRMTEDIRRDLEILADFYALSPSSLAHSYLVRSIRKERELYPEAFNNKGVLAAEIHVSNSAKNRKTG